MARLTVHTSVHLAPDTEVRVGSIVGAPPWLVVDGSTGSAVTVHFGSGAEVRIAIADRLTAAIAEIRAAAVRELGHDPAVGDLAAGDHYAGMPPAVPA